MFKKVCLSLLLLGAVILAAAQNTRVRGIIRDAETGEPLPFVGVYFDNTAIGISTDLEGRYSLETRSREAQVLTASLIGYESQSVTITQGTFTEINFNLVPDPRQLEAALVKPDNRYIRSILAKLDRQREVNDPENAPDWQSRLYTKIEFDVQNLEDLLKIGALDKNIGFVRSYADTSAITGKAYIPALISENVSDVYHSQEQGFTREVMRASRISGLEEDNALRQFTGSYLLKTNFYRENISVFNLVIPNPAAGSAHIFYNYYLVDSLQVEGRKTYVLRFHPKKLVTSPTLDGELQIDAEDYGIRSVHASLSGESNVKWIRHIQVDLFNRRLPNGRWFYGDESLFIDFAISVNDDSRLLSFQGNRKMNYGKPVFGPITDPDALSSQEAVVMRDVIRGDESYWNGVRPFALTERERGIYHMVDEIQRNKVYKWSYAIVRTAMSNYIEVKPWKVELGRWPQFLAYNELEGLRLQFGGRTLKEFSKKVRLGGYVAFGCRDLRPKGNVTAEFMFKREQTRKLTLDLKHDYVQFGGGSVFTTQSIFSSLLARSQSEKLSLVRSADILYEHEFAPWLNSALEWRSQRIWSNRYVPFIRQDGTVQNSFAMNQVHALLRFSYDERVNRNYFVKSYLFSKYPSLALDLTAGIKGLTQDDFNYVKATATINWKVPSTAIGFGRLYLQGGAIWGSVPYPMLKIHDANQTFFVDRHAFSCMDYYEFVSDRWLTGYYEHNFNGFFLGKIPGIKKLELREVATIRMAWGSLSPENGENAPYKLLRSTNLESIDKIPYLEAGIGISNIFRLFRIDCFWRLTHPKQTGRQNFAVNIGLDIDF